MAEWDAEVVVTPADAAAIVGATYGAFRDSRVVAYAEGWDNAGFLFDETVTPCGIIDWGDMHAGSPAIDLAVAHTMLPPEAHAAFRAAYGPIDDALWNAARWRGIYTGLLCLDYGIEADQLDMRRCGGDALALIARGL